jgi:hypothetical protein
MHFYRYLRVTLLAVVALSVSRPGLAAESYDSCVGFIDTIPTVINEQGTWCLRQNLTTSAGSGNMISIVTDNVTIDCNGFKIGGLGGGTDCNRCHPGNKPEQAQSPALHNSGVRNRDPYLGSLRPPGGRQSAGSEPKHCYI